jgi:hypothetical protein
MKSIKDNETQPNKAIKSSHKKLKGSVLLKELDCLIEANDRLFEENKALYEIVDNLKQLHFEQMEKLKDFYVAQILKQTEYYENELKSIKQ